MLKEPTIKKPPVSVFMNKKLNDKQLEAMKSLRNWDKNSSLETLIRRINEEIYYEQVVAKQINERSGYIINDFMNEIHIGSLRHTVMRAIGCSPPSMHGRDEPLCRGLEDYIRIFQTHLKAPLNSLLHNPQTVALL